MRSRRRFLGELVACGAALALPVACTRHEYLRPAEELDLGPVKSLLYSRVHLRERAVLVNRDIEGWSVLSARCTYIGCDLTYQDPVLLCPCCRTRFTLDGIPYRGWPATTPLPWIDVYFRDGHLYANPGKIRSASFRFTTPEIEAAISELRRRVKEAESMADEILIPEILTGASDGEVGRMFLENDPNFVAELKMIR